MLKFFRRNCAINYIYIVCLLPFYFIHKFSLVDNFNNRLGNKFFQISFLNLQRLFTNLWDILNNLFIFFLIIFAFSFQFLIFIIHFLLKMTLFFCFYTKIIWLFFILKVTSISNWSKWLHIIAWTMFLLLIYILVIYILNIFMKLFNQYC